MADDTARFVRYAKQPAANRPARDRNAVRGSGMGVDSTEKWFVKLDKDAAAAMSPREISFATPINVAELRTMLVAATVGDGSCEEFLRTALKMRGVPPF